MGHESNICKFVSTENGTSSGYGPELRTGMAGSTGLPIEHYRQKVDTLEASLAPLISGWQNSRASESSLPPARNNHGTEQLRSSVQPQPRSHNRTATETYNTISQAQNQTTITSGVPRGCSDPTILHKCGGQTRVWIPSLRSLLHILLATVEISCYTSNG
ncbi:hypothetical protein ACSBR1_025103 [Camellia fascicularis]